MSCYQIKLKIKVYAHFLCYFHTSDHLHGQNMDKSPSFFTSSRGGRKLAFEGFTYNKDKQDSKSGKTYWNVIFNSAKVE